METSLALKLAGRFRGSRCTDLAAASRGALAKQPTQGRRYSHIWGTAGPAALMEMGRACVQVWAPGPALTSFPAHPRVPPCWAAGGSHMGPSQYPCWPVFCWELALFSLAPWGPVDRGRPAGSSGVCMDVGPQDTQACVVGPEPRGRATLRSCTCWVQDCWESGHGLETGSPQRPLPWGYPGPPKFSWPVVPREDLDAPELCWALWSLGVGWARTNGVQRQSVCPAHTRGRALTAS